jgi:two-component system phosphate regulon response regulator PhoB
LLLVDDEPAMRLLCRVNLPHSGFDVTEAADAEEALAHAEGEAFDLALLDVMMPGMSGFELAARLRADARTKDLPIVFLSARADRRDMRRGFELGAADYVTKPFDPINLGEHLQAVLHAAATGDLDRLRRTRLGDDEE